MVAQFQSDNSIIVVPCYNEAARLDLSAFDAFLAGDDGVSLLFVDDGSSDNTPHLLERLRARHSRAITVLRLERNVGKAEAVRRGVQVALRRRPAIVGYWDADLATPLEAIRQFRESLVRRSELRVVMGSRVRLLGRQICRHWSRHMLGRSFATAASFVLGLPVYDTQCGAKLFRVTAETGALFQLPFRTRWIFDVELLARLAATARDAGGPGAEDVIYEFPLERWQDVRGSRLQPLDFLLAAIDLIALSWRYNRRDKPAARRQSLTPPAVPPSTDVPHREAA